MRQTQFLDVIDRDEAERRFRDALDLSPLGEETVSLELALDRVLARGVRSPVDVPGFTRSNVDGFALQAADTFDASEEKPRRLTLSGEVLATGVAPTVTVESGSATAIATGGVLPRGADAVVMVEHTDLAGDGDSVDVRRPLVPGAHLSQAGSDIARGETILRRGTRLTSRETGVLAAVGLAETAVFRRPRIAILSTGDELVPPGTPLGPGQLHDSNGPLLADVIRELGGEPLVDGIVPDDVQRLRAALDDALQKADLVLLSGGTSKGAGDLNARVVAEHPGARVLVHGVALKPGKPICLSVVNGTPVVILPGFPTSAVFTFHEFVAPVIRAWAGRPAEQREEVAGVLPGRVLSEVGRTEYMLVGLVPAGNRADPPVAVPLGKGSGSVTAFGAADGFITIPRDVEQVPAGAEVRITLLGRHRAPADLVIQGSHCLGLDILMDALFERGHSARFLATGSGRGLDAVRAGHAHVAGIHLYDAATGLYNTPFLGDGDELALLPGYRRRQGLVHRRDDPRLADAVPGRDLALLLDDALAAGARMVQRNRGSGTRALIDELLGDRRPAGYSDEARSHHAVAAAVAQGRSDWGIAIENVARLYNLEFRPLRDESFDFVVQRRRLAESPALTALADALRDEEVRRRLAAAGFGTEPPEDAG